MKLISKLIFAVMLVALAGSSCKKEIPVDLNWSGPEDTTATFIDIQGTQWASIESDFFSDERAMAMMTVDDKLLVTYLDISSLSGNFSGTSFLEHGQSFGGFGIEKLQLVDGSVYGLGLMDTYGGVVYNPGQNSPWTGVASVGTNMYSYEKYNDNFYAACGIAPYIRSNESGPWADVGDGLDAKVFDLINFDGKLVAGGGFTSSGSTSLNRVAQWDGTSWTPLGQGLDGTVTDLLIHDGKLIALGYFESSGSGNTNCSYVAQWDGTSWTDVGGGLVGGGSARKGISYGDQLIIGGEFTGSASVLSSNIIKFDGTSWQTLGGGVSERIEELDVYNGRLYVANGPSFGSNFILRLD